MNILNNNHKKYGAITKLTLIVSYTSCVFAFVFALFSFFYLHNKSILFKLSLLFSVLNLANTLYFYVHQKLEITYNILSLLGFGVSFILCLYTGGINSFFTFFLVTIVFAGFLTNPFYGKLWFTIISIAIGIIYTLDYLNISFPNYIPEDFDAEFNLFFIVFFMLLYGGVFGRIITKSRANLKRSKKNITHQNEEKSVMLKEIHHRVKNNLQVINSLLQIQSRNITNQDTKMIFKSAQNRIVAMGSLHEKIYNTENLKYIDVKNHFKDLTDDLIKSFEVDTTIQVALHIDPIKLSIETLLPLCLIINELISNSLKHAFKNQDTGEIDITLKDLNNQQYELIFKDNGVGFSKSSENTTKPSTGLILTHSFAKQLNGQMELLETEKGTAYRLIFSEI